MYLFFLSIQKSVFFSKQQPMRSKHCQTCQHCVRRYDHHCPWIENCVGERNHRWFVFYLIIQLLVLLWGLYIAWWVWCCHQSSLITAIKPLQICLCFHRTGLCYVPTWQLWLQTNGALLSVTVLVALLSLIVLLLLGSHLYLISLNITTWEFMSRHRISYLKHCGIDENPFDRGAFHNLWGFFCVWGTVVWEQVYFREGSNLV